MDVQKLIVFLKWCTLINIGLLILSSLIFLFIPDFVYQMQSYWIEVPRETFNAVMYSILAFYKVMIIFFNLVPWLVLRKMA